GQGELRAFDLRVAASSRLRDFTVRLYAQAGRLQIQPATAGPCLRLNLERALQAGVAGAHFERGQGQAAVGPSALGDDLAQLQCANRGRDLRGIGTGSRHDLPGSICTALQAEVEVDRLA